MSVLLSLGSNQGDRAVHLQAAIDALNDTDQIEVNLVSCCYETDALGVTDQSAFLNLAIEIETALEPLEFLNVAKDIERRLGREAGLRWGPRIIDIDIVLWNEETISTTELVVPHREFRRRAFVLAPLAEIAGERIDPETGLTVNELAGRPEAVGRVTRIEKLDH